MAAKTSWHRYGTKLCHGHPMYNEFMQNCEVVGLSLQQQQDPVLVVV